MTLESLNHPCRPQYNRGARPPPPSALLGKTVMLKLNGGLGTGMGLEKAKSLLPLKGDDTFLDFIAKQVAHMRQTTGVDLAFMLMNSFATSARRDCAEIAPRL